MACDLAAFSDRLPSIEAEIVAACSKVDAPDSSFVGIAYVKIGLLT